MSLSGSFADEFRDAFTIARRVQTSKGGFTTFRRHFPGDSLDDLHEIWDRVWPRAQRVKYFEETHGNTYVSVEKLGCSDLDTHITVGHEITFNDEDGNMHTLNIWSTSEIEPRIGQTRNASYQQMLYTLQLRAYFANDELSDIAKRITSHRITQVKCMTTER